MLRVNARFSKTAIAIGLLAGLSACQSTGEEQPPAVSNKSELSAVTHENPVPGGSMNINQQLSFATKDLADRLGVDSESIKIKAVRQVTWNSGALGCPKPGMSYIQVLVPGVLILLDGEGKTYGYHAAKNEKPFHCPPRQAVIPGSIEKEDLA